MPRQGDLQVWWIPQIPGSPFIVPVRNLREAKLLLDALAEYDKFQYEQNVKPDYSNVGGLSMYEDDEWLDWYNEDAGVDFDEYCEGHPELGGSGKETEPCTRNDTTY